jgi:predicted transcriptional regulator of viral defense system
MILFMKKNSKLNSELKVHDLFLKHQGYLRASEAFKIGIHPQTLYSLRDQGEIELVSRGLFRLASMPPLKSPNLFAVGIKVPDGVLCLQSALAFHKLIKPEPNEISIALVKGTDKPQIRDLPLKFYLISEPAFSEGIEVHQRDGIDIRVYCMEKTLVDCFKFRSKIGLNICLESLQVWWKRKNKNPTLLLDFAKTCRMENVIRPYLELLRLQDR